MKTIAVILCVAVFALQGPNGGTTKKTESPYRAESSAYVKRSKDAAIYVTENRSFRFLDVLDDRGSTYEALLLLEETYHNERTDGIEGVQGEVRIRAWTLQPGRERKLRWSFRKTGNEGLVQDRLLRISTWGCCDVPITYSYYNVLTGAKLYVSNSDLLEIRGDGDGPQASRYIAFGYEGMGNLDEPPLLQYGTDKKVAQRFTVTSSRKYFDAPQIFVSTNEEPKKSLDLRGSSMSFTIVLRYQDGVELRIPVQEDAIHPDKATLPKGYSLRPES